MEREIQSSRPTPAEAHLGLPDLPDLLALPGNIHDALVAQETQKLETEAQELEAKAQAIRDRLATGNVLQERKSSPEIQQKAGEWDAKAKQEILGHLDDLDLQDGETVGANYQDIHDLEYSQYTNHVSLAVTKHNGCYFVSNDTRTTYDCGYNSQPPTASSPKIIAHEDLRQPLHTSSPGPFLLENFTESRWVYQKANIITTTTIIHCNRLLMNTLRLLGQPEDPSLEVTSNGWNTTYARTLSDVNGIKLVIAGKYRKGNQSTAPLTLSGVSLTLTSGEATLKSYHLSASSLNIESGSYLSHERPIRIKDDLRFVKEATNLLKPFVTQE